MLRLKIRLTEKWFRHRIRDTFSIRSHELHAVSLTYSNRGKLSSRPVERQVPSLKSGSCVPYPIDRNVGKRHLDTVIPGQEVSASSRNAGLTNS